MFLLKRLEFSNDTRSYLVKAGLKCSMMPNMDIVEGSNFYPFYHEVKFLNEPVTRCDAIYGGFHIGRKNMGIIDFCNTYSVLRKEDLWTQLRLTVLKKAKKVEGYLFFCSFDDMMHPKTNGIFIMNRLPDAIIKLDMKDGQYISIGDFRVEVVDGKLVQTIITH